MVKEYTDLIVFRIAVWLIMVSVLAFSLYQLVHALVDRISEWWKGEK